MDAQPGRAFDDSQPYRVRITDPGEIAAALPHLVGFRPAESVVLIALTGPGGGRVGLTVRADLPPPEHAAALAGALARSLAADRPAAVLLVVVSESADERPPPFVRDLTDAPELPHRLLVHHFVLTLALADIPVRNAMLVRGGRWWSYDCPHPCCAPGAGTPLPAEVTEFEVAAIASGQVVERDRGELVRRIAPLTGPAADAMDAASMRVGDRYARGVLADAEGTARRSWTAILRALARCRPGIGTPLGDREVARVVWGLTDIPVRDRALGLALGDDAPAAEVLWTECTRRSPPPLDAAPATLLAVSAWLRGDGAMANVALDRALRSRPGYVLAELLAQGLAACLPPERLRAMVGDTVAGLDDPAPAS
jgi:hypothetical protein